MRLAGGVLGMTMLLASAVSAQAVRYIDGVFVAPKNGTAPIELIAYAEARTTGVLRMLHGALDDAPLVHEVAGVLVSLPNWQPLGALVGTTELFRDELAERRQLSFAVQRRNVYAVAVRLVDLERRERIEQLLKSVRASAEVPGYAFVIVGSENHVKYFPIRLTPDER
jgi:hypothetical protein